MCEPQLQEPATRTRGRTAEMERREARHLRQRRRQRSRARVSDLDNCEPSKPHCRSDRKRPRRPTSDGAPARRSTQRELSPNHRCASPNCREPATRTRGCTAEMERREARHLRQRRRHRSNAQVFNPDACEPHKPCCNSDPNIPAKHPTTCLHAEAHGASCSRTTDARAPTTGTRNAHAWPYPRDRAS
jgi:hypothetical protein